MTDEDLAEIAQALLATAEAAVATDDVLAMLCIYFSRAAPGPSAEFASSLKRMRETEDVAKTDSFVSLAARMEQALTVDLELKFLSLKKSHPNPTTPEALGDKLRLIHGGLS